MAFTLRKNPAGAKRKVRNRRNNFSAGRFGLSPGAEQGRLRGTPPRDFAMLLHFYKMNGAGNDFIMVDNRDLELSAVLDLETIAALCDRHRGVGADGLLAVEPAAGAADYRFRYYNADGGEAEMCGNGARCFGRFTAHLSDPPRHRVSFETIAGVLTAEMVEENVRIAMSDPQDLRLDTGAVVPGLTVPLHFLNTGVPHAVAFLPTLEALADCDVFTVGRAIRHHEAFAPAGTNANFAAVLEPGHIAIRTYERGVEDETLACGTGMVACALVHHLLHGASGPVSVDVRGGDTLHIGFTAAGHEFTDVTLTGPADFVFDGQASV